MRVYKIDKKQKMISLEPENLDDLWTLNLIISCEDIIGSKTTRRFRVDGSKDSEKKTVFVNITVEKKELDLKKGCLKVTGIIVSGHPEEYVDLNSHHSIEIMQETKIDVVKKKILDYELNLIDKAKTNSLLPKIYLLVIDDDSAMFAKVNARSYSIVAEIKSGKSGKRLDSEEYRNKFFKTIYDAISNNEKEIVVVAGPGFEKDHFKEYVSSKPDAKKFRFTHINTTGLTGLNELLKGGSIKEILSEFLLQRDVELVNLFYKEIAKDGNVIYGPKGVISALASGNVKELIITDKYFMDNYDSTRNILTDLEKTNLKYHIISSDTDAGCQIDNIGGLVAFVYYKQN